jgi:hypothetical protein
MDSYLSELKKSEKQSIVEVMAFMSYNPSIGRVLEKGGVEKFQQMVLKKVEQLKSIVSIDNFDHFHRKWVQEFVRKIKTNKDKRCSYGQAQKAINVFLKVLVDWSNLPDRITAKRLKPYLHVTLDSS